MQNEVHNIGDLVCWSPNHDILGTIIFVEHPLPGEGEMSLYKIEWIINKNEEYALIGSTQTTHTQLGVSNLKKYLKLRLQFDPEWEKEFKK